MQSTRMMLLASIMTVALSACVQSGFDNEVGANGLPKPRAIYSRYIAAIGGEDVIRSHSSTTSRGRFVLSDFGVEGSVEAFAAAPDSVSMKIDLSGLGSIESGYNGDIGWSIDPLQGSSIMEGNQLAYMAQQADYYLPLNLASAFTQQQTVAIEPVAGEDCYHVQMLDAAGNPASLFFAVDSGLLLRSSAMVASPLGEIEVITDFAEYGEFGGYRVPIVTNINQGGQQISIHFTEIAFDNVSPGRFEPPVSIKALLDRR